MHLLFLSANKRFLIVLNSVIVSFGFSKYYHYLKVPGTSWRRNGTRRILFTPFDLDGDDPRGAALGVFHSLTLLGNEFLLRLLPLLLFLRLVLLHAGRVPWVFDDHRLRHVDHLWIPILLRRDLCRDDAVTSWCWDFRVLLVYLHRDDDTVHGG